MLSWFWRLGSPVPCHFIAEPPTLAQPRASDGRSHLPEFRRGRLIQSRPPGARPANPAGYSTVTVCGFRAPDRLSPRLGSQRNPESAEEPLALLITTRPYPYVYALLALGLNTR